MNGATNCNQGFRIGVSMGGWILVAISRTSSLKSSLNLIVTREIRLVETSAYVLRVSLT